MLFTDFYFMFFFLPIVLLILLTIKSNNLRFLELSIASYIFYGAWNYKFIPLLLFSTCVDFFCGLIIFRTYSQRVRKSALIFSISCNLFILGVFKYFNFFISNVDLLMSTIGINFTSPMIEVILPVGISFYTFQSMSYTIDVYRGVITPTQSFFKFAAYVSLFPQLVAGPIVRYRDIGAQLDRLGNTLNLSNFSFGFQVFLLGLFKKVLIADNLAQFINPMFAHYQSLSTFEAWLAVLGYTFQIYFDFSGYSDMAIGLGKMLGINLPFNFNSPYKARNMSDFWRRWHISLSSWLKDYLYIPLGGNRKTVKRTAFNAVVVFALGGLWHGAAWTFIAWGLYHGILVMLHNICKNFWDKRSVLIQRGFTFLLVTIGWVFFRSDNLPMALSLLKNMFYFTHTTPLWSSDLIMLLLINAFLLIGVNCLPNTNTYKGTQNIFRAILFAALFVLTIIALNSLRIEFLYYQF